MSGMAYTDLREAAAALREKLDRDERAAREAATGNDGEASWSNEQGAPGEHITRWDPARVLDEVKAKREILDLWEASQDDNLPPDALILLDRVIAILAGDTE